MKHFFLSLLSIIVFISSTSLIAQENENYLKVIAKSLPQGYVQSTSNLFFTVQIGAYKNTNLSLENLDNVIITEEGQLTKYRLGEFSSYQLAIDFKKMLLSVCKDAFIVSIKNGNRIHISEALKDLNEEEVL